MCDKDEGQYSRTCDHVHSYEKIPKKYVQKKFMNINICDEDEDQYSTCDHLYRYEKNVN